MTTEERDPDLEPTVEIQRPIPAPRPGGEVEDVEEFDPEKTLVREDWESVVIRRVAPHVAAVQDEVADDAFGWESEGLRRLSREVQNRSAESG
ncbi:MAG TPA: hypothetical protein VJQ52_11800 [Steroidobacteraceae bacterium]|nr:hypothetical protein [Steroidobacteraceae bacterium]